MDRARAVALEAVDCLTGVMRDEKAPHFVRLAAAKELLDRAGFQVPRYLRVQADPDTAAAAEALSRDRLSPEVQDDMVRVWVRIVVELGTYGREAAVAALPAVEGGGDGGQERA